MHRIAFLGAWAIAILGCLAPSSLVAQSGPSQSGPSHAGPAGVFVARDGQARIILVSGRISHATEAAFLEALRLTPQGTRPRIYLASPGGSLTPALNMGRAIREARLETFVPGGAGCWSACGLMWLAGAERHLDPTGRVGFHTAYIQFEGSPGQASSAGNALIAEYLGRLGYNQNAIRFFTAARPDQIFELKADQFRSYGITVQQTATRAPAAAQAASGHAIPAMAGLWIGHYQCGAEIVAVRMAVQQEGGRTLSAKFDFGPTANTPQVPRGSFGMRGVTLENGAVQFHPEGPTGPRRVSLQGNVIGDVFAAQILGGERCAPMTLRRQRG